ncbi:hypothetical protein IV203_030788 [Nitzschia inconspicua]|uniref:Uncharacterized protein n=1 Tax=Nitzschia inconspicua TaxID=303405 RepID=A0A9K3LT40_9STRA|nr:hypothetical protein IV203_030788 [Nitzschia inconspicua]
MHPPRPSSTNSKSSYLSSNWSNTTFSDKGERDEPGAAMPLMYRYEDWEASPFDEPPVTAELDLDRMVYDIKLGLPPPSRLSKAYVIPRAVIIKDDNFDACGEVEWEDDGASRPHDESLYFHEHCEHHSSPKRGTAKRSSSLRQNKFGRNENCSDKRRISFSRQLVDVLPEQLNHRREFSQTSISPKSSPPGVDLKENDADEEDEYDDEDSLLSQENSLEYFLRGEWIEDDEFFAPINCTSSKRRSSGSISAADNKEDQDSCLCGLDEATSFFALLDRGHFSSKPFSVPFKKWKEYTSLDSACLGVSFSRSESCISSTTQRSMAYAQSIFSKREHVNDEKSMPRQAAAESTFKLPTLQQSLQGIFRRIFEQNPAGGTSKTSEETQKKDSDSDTLSLTDTNVSDSEESVLAYSEVGCTVKGTS